MDPAQRPPYDAVDFKTLAQKDSLFKQLWQRCSGRLNFQDPQTVQCLSRAILAVDFGLQLSVPDDRLCPPIPNRWNYVAWIHGLIDSTSPSYLDRYNPDAKIRGLDIGTGASAIYTMLCLRSRVNWSMCATDIDKKSFESAARNLALNNLMTRTKLLQTTPSNPLIPLVGLAVDYLDFTICNPPFFESDEEMQSSLTGSNKSSGPSAICTGSTNEMVAPGGDVGFVTRIVEESLTLRDKVRWYTSMFGKLSSLKTIITLLKSHGINNYAVGSIQPGGATKRWILAWSFGDMRPSNRIARIQKIGHGHIPFPFPTTHEIEMPGSMAGEAARPKLNSLLEALDAEWNWQGEKGIGIFISTQNVWSRAYRRAKQKADGADAMQEAGEVRLVVRVVVMELGRRVVLHWVRGRDQVLFESFCGMLDRGFKSNSS